MGLDVYVENQVHGRTPAGSDANRSFSRVVAAAPTGSLLAGVHPHGDTMFNVPQLTSIESEFDEILVRRPELSPDTANLRELFERVRRKRGYLWISGD